MARQQDTCWRCGADWIATDGQRAALRLIPGGALTHRQNARQALIPTTVPGDARAAAQAQHDVDRWIDEGGSLGAEQITSPTAARR